MAINWALWANMDLEIINFWLNLHRPCWSGFPDRIDLFEDCFFPSWTKFQNVPPWARMELIPN